MRVLARRLGVEQPQARVLTAGRAAIRAGIAAPASAHADPSLLWTETRKPCNLEGVTTRAPRVLVVEDDAATARVVKGALTEAGFTVETLDKGFLLVAVVMRFQPDMVVLDLNLPDMRGDTAMKMVRRATNVGGKSLPVVIYSGMPMEQLMEIQGHLGAVGCIQKPASLNTIVDRLCQLLSWPRKDQKEPPEAAS